MRILLISFYFVEYAIELANALAKDHQIHLILSEKRVKETVGDNLDDHLSPHCSCFLLPPANSRVGKLKLLTDLYFQYRKFAPNVVHIQECSNLLNLFFVLYKPKPLVVTVHDVEPHPGRQASLIPVWRIKLLNFLRRHAYNKIIVHGRKLKAQFEAKTSRLSGDVFAVPHGCLGLYGAGSRMTAREEPFSVLFFGRVQEYKGLKYLIAAEPAISEMFPDFKVIVAGRGDDLDLYKEKLSGNPHFEVHDRFIENQEVPYFFQRATLVVLPYIEASQSGVTAVAFAFGKPVIASDVGSLGEMVLDGETGILVPPVDPEALQRAIVDLLRDPVKRQRLGNAAKRASETYLSWESVAKSTARVYENIFQYSSN